MLDKEQIAIIGPGVMGEAMAKSLLAIGDLQPEQIMVSGPREARLSALHEEYGFRTTTDNHSAVLDADIIILAVKPQTVQQVMDDVHGAIPEAALVISIVAGTTLETLTKGTGHTSVVRSMPNTPAQVAQGITVWTATPAVNGRQLEQTRAVLSAFGEEIYVQDEDYLDMATALSGTGPAYAFLFMEAMVDAGVHLGFPRRIAEQLVVQTLKGSVAFYEHSPRHMARLRNQVTSPGGTSAAALYYLEKAGFRTALSRAIWAAYERSVQLGQGQKRGPVGTE
ncbi:MAG: pyrroline-5-carboxylate reductase [Anaerolineales bacterium]|jgi:pyrroline-5-carboxylate reductase